MGHPLVRCAERVKKSQALGVTILLGSRGIWTSNNCEALETLTSKNCHPDPNMFLLGCLDRQCGS
jgi:hypothetical protein